MVLGKDQPFTDAEIQRGMEEIGFHCGKIFRAFPEVTFAVLAWPTMTDAERRAVLDVARKRLAEQMNGMSPPGDHLPV
jgi:predicted Fe-S protein YdhL (DUF1289 family)